MLVVELIYLGGLVNCLFVMFLLLFRGVSGWVINWICVCGCVGGWLSCCALACCCVCWFG